MKSIGFVFTPSAGSATTYDASVVPGSPGCSTVSGVTTCTLTITLAPKTYTAGVTTYDGALDGSGHPTGKVLSANQNVPLSVVAGTANHLNLTLDGVPQSLEVTPGAGSSLTGNQNAGFSLTKCVTTPQQIDVVGLDADSNVIVGSGAPTPSLVSSDTVHVPVATPAPAAPNAFTLTHAISGSDQDLTLTASVTPLSGSGATPPPNVAVPLVIHGGTTICGVMTEYLLPTTNSHPNGITQGPDGAMWFTETDINKVGRITTDGSIAEYTTSDIGPFGIAAGPAGEAALWYVSQGSSDVGKTSLAGTITNYTTPTSSSGPKNIAVGPDNALWFTESYVNKIGRITTNGVITEYSNPYGINPFGIAAGSDGNLWFTSSTGINYVTTSGAFQPYPTTARPISMAPGPDGALWFADCVQNKIGRITTSGTIAEYSIPTSSSNPDDVVSGPDGALWFTECNGNKIGRITTAGVVTAEYSLSTPASGPQSIVPGPDGALWFTECAGNRIGRLQ